MSWFSSITSVFSGGNADLRAQSKSEADYLYERVRQQHAASLYADEQSLKELRLNLFYTFEERIPLGLRSEFYSYYVWLLGLEENIFDMPEKPIQMDLKQEVEFKEALRRKESFFANEGRVIEVLTDGLERIFTHICENLPEAEGTSPFTIPLVFALPNPKEIINNLIGELWQSRYVDTMVFVNVARRIHLNLAEVSGITNLEEPNKPFLLPKDNKAPLLEIVEGYLKGTPFYDLFTMPVPLRITHEDRSTHMHIVGGSGAGKTQLLQTLVLHDLQADDPPGLVIIDSQGDLIDKISHLALFNHQLKDKLVYITPKDINYPPAINIFDVNRERYGSYDAVVREQITAGVIETFDYLFRGLLGADLTAKQGIFFRYVARLMLAIPETMGRNATILDLIDLMADPEPYQAAIQSLPPFQRDFFLRDFPSKAGQKGTFDQTKEQIRYRLQGILENPTLYRLFTSPETKIDLFAELNKGSIILVDTAKDFLKGSSAHFGRIFISLVLQAVLERAAIPENERRPAYLVVNEAAEYFDDDIDDLLSQVRKYRLGCCFAHQYLDQCTGPLRASFASNTGIKMAAGVSTSDARALAPDMRTTADFIIEQPKLHFACHIRNVTPQAVSIPIEVGLLEKQPRLSAEAYEEMRAKIRDRVSRKIVEEKPARTHEEPRPKPAASSEPIPASDPSPDPEPPPTMPFMITRAQKEALRQRDHTDGQMRKLQPEDAHRILEEPIATGLPLSPKSQRKRPKKRRGPLIDTDA